MKPLSRSLLCCLAVSAAAIALAQPLGVQAQTPDAPSASPAVGNAAAAAPVLAHYGALVSASYEDTLSATRDMRQAIQAFLKAPTAATLASARKAWLAARELYGQTEAFRFYGGPIDGDNGPEGRINAWPMDESYVDYVAGAPDAGIINNRQLSITRQRLVSLNEKDGEENIATGWHAIEFLLWGQDQSDTGPGNRSFEDYVDGKRPNADRRRQYLRVVTDLLVDDLSAVAAAWAPDKANYRARFTNGGNESVRRMFVGLGSLSRGELAGERLEVALASQDQEDEHSCFSDNTHRDVVNNALGMQNVWLGRYQRRDGSLLQGPGLRDLVAAKDSAVAQRTTHQIDASVAAAQAIRAPFDQEIKGGRDAPGRARVQATIDSLVQQSKDLVLAAQAVGITRLTIRQPSK